jgi:hypothetical protein
MAIVLAVSCVVASVVTMIMAFASITESATNVSPSDLAQGVGVASVPSFFAVPLGILGIVLVVAGLIVRQPVTDGVRGNDITSQREGQP